ncbi:MAG: radical SAM protein [archaeon]
MGSKYFDLKVGFSCNNYCVHCVITDKKETEDLSTEKIKEIIDTLDEDYIVGFTGGEATIRSDFIEIAKYAKNTGHDVYLQTNGTMFYDDNFTKELVGVLDNVLIAIHSHIPEIHNKIVDCPDKLNMYERTVDGFKNLIKYDFSVVTQTVISNYNIKDLPETYDFIQGIAPGIYMNLTYPHPNGNAFHNAKDILPRYSDIKEYIHKILDNYAPFINTEAIPICYLYPYHENVNYNVDQEIINPDHMMRSGLDPANASDTNTLFDDTGRIEDYRSADLTEKRKGPLCRQCVFNSRCAGVWKEYVHFFKDRFDLFPIREE